MVSFQTLMQTLVNSVYGEAIDQPGVHTTQFYDSPAVQWRKTMTKSALLIQRRFRARKGAASIKPLTLTLNPNPDSNPNPNPHPRPNPNPTQVRLPVSTASRSTGCSSSPPCPRPSTGARGFALGS